MTKSYCIDKTHGTKPYGVCPMLKYNYNKGGYDVVRKATCRAKPKPPVRKVKRDRTKVLRALKSP